MTPTTQAIATLLMSMATPADQVAQVVAILDGGDRMVTYREAAQRLGISVREVSRRVSSGRLPVVRSGHRTAHIPFSALAVPNRDTSKKE